jgi:hypothetical protein
MSMSSVFEYYSPSNVFPHFKQKPNFLLQETSFDDITLVDDIVQAKAIDYTQYRMLKHNNAFMKVSIAINDASALTNADYVEIFVQSGNSVNGAGKITSPANVQNLYYESDMYLGKKINSTSVVDYFQVGVQFKQGNSALITKDSFDYQSDGTYFVTKFIAFPLWNSTVNTVGFENKNTMFDKNYGVAIKPFGAFINNANASVSVEFVVPNIDMQSIAKLTQYTV